jgi:tetratricopeptide (TPR) repeat protein
VPTVGASGAVAGCMGAFLVRFPTTEIDMAWFFRFRLYRFKMAAYWLLPAWLLMEVFYGAMFGSMTGVAHWAHVGGFVFGAAVALALKFSGWEARLDQAVEEQVSLQADPEIAEASGLIERREYEPALQMLQAYAARKPDPFDAFNLLQQAYWRMGDVPRYQEAMTKVIALHLKAREYEPALQGFDEYVQTGGDPRNLPPATWLDLGRAAEAAGHPERALVEFEKVAAAYAGTRPELDAHMAAARALKRLGRPAEALQKYQAVKASAIPHLDLEAAVEAGIRELGAARGAAV